MATAVVTYTEEIKHTAEVQYDEAEYQAWLEVEASTDESLREFLLSGREGWDKFLPVKPDSYVEVKSAQPLV